MKNSGIVTVAVWALICGFSQAEVTDRTADFKVAAGFKLEHLHKVTKEEGSWVAMTEDGKGRLITADQYGKLYRVIPPPLTGGDAKVEALPIPIGGAHGLLWHKGVLYISVNENAKDAPASTGVWMVKENGDGWDKPVLAMPIKAGGEHGVHSLVTSPDEQWIYLVTGNYAHVPDGITDSFPAKIWAEDQLLTRNPDGRGHAATVMAPGGWVGRFKPDGSNWQLVSMGQRNTYGIAFHDSGELVSYDADMEWDFGMPWYRPTRICHIVPGGELGWRNGSGKWPEYYEDSMAPLLNIGPGSPTGVHAGRGFKAPAKYQQAIYAYDWTFATIYAIHLTPDGASFKAEKEEFIAGAGLPVTMGVIAKDGAFYFATGGRRGESNLWRVVYTGSESTAPQPAKKVPSEAREMLAGFIEKPETADINRIYPHLGSGERTLRFMARAALERLPDASWAEPRLGKDSNPLALINGSMALARLDAKTHRKLILSTLLRIDWAKLTTHQKLNWLRALGLVFMRDKAPDDAEKAAVLAKIDASYPSKERFLDFELARMLCYLQAPGVVARTLRLMDEAPAEQSEPWESLVERNSKYGKDIGNVMKNHPPTTQIHYLYCLRAVKGPWAPGERRRAFNWFREIDSRNGGASYAPSIAMIRTQIFENGTEQEKAEFAADAKAPAQKPKVLPPVQGPGRSWTLDEVVKTVSGDLSGRDKAKGQAMFEASMCSACHKFGDLGQGQGPDLTNLAGRFTATDLAHSIVETSEVISDQYEFTEFVTHDGKTITGRVLNEQDEILSIGINPFDFTQRIELSRSNIKSEAPSKVSPMPPGMINRLNPEELKDLFAYLLGK
jgi:putative heme-binding domain-containing protein